MGAVPSAAFAVVLLLTAAGLPLAGSTPQRAVPNLLPGVPALSLSLSSSGVLSVNLTVTDPNGASLRYAMDGNFTPLVASLPVNASERSSILARINAAESTPIVSSYFGNRDGSVDPGEVTLFEELIQSASSSASRILPVGTLPNTGTFVLTLDGAAPSSDPQLNVAFSGAVGPDSSVAPIVVYLSLTYPFPYSGTQHTLSAGIHLPTAGIAVSPLPGVEIPLSLSTPSGTSITGTDGLGSVSTSADPLGWGSSSASGLYTPSPNSTVSFHFRSSFPLGDALVASGAAALVAAAALLMLRRRRRRRAAAEAPGLITLSGGGGPVGPSGSV